MINDLKNLVLSYLSLEEILILLENHLKLRTKIIAQNFKVLPNLAKEVEKGNLQTVKYLCEKGFKPSMLMIEIATMYGHLEIVKFFHKTNIPINSSIMDCAVGNGRLLIVKYLRENGVPFYLRTIEYARNNFDIYSYLTSDLPQQLII